MAVRLSRLSYDESRGFCERVLLEAIEAFIGFNSFLK